MKLEKLLAENMLRFGVKGITETMLKKYLTEQSTYTSDPLYRDFLKLLTGLSKRYWDGTKKGAAGKVMTEDERVKLFNEFKTKIEARQQKTSDRVNKVIRSTELVSIKSTMGETTKTYITGSKGNPRVYTSVYPPIGEPNPKLQNFFLSDDVVTVSPENEAGFKLMIKDLITTIPSIETITNITVYAGSSTSQVPTRYSMPKDQKYKTIEEGQRNNIPLANARYDVIVAKLAILVKEQIPQFTGQITIAPKTADLVKPNNGPVYTNKERAYFFSGSKDGKVLPDKVAEYNQTYGPFKGSYGGVTIYTVGKDDTSTPPAEFEQVTQNWSIAVKFDQNIPSTHPSKKSRSRGKAGGGIVWSGEIRQVCPVWNKK